MQLLLQISEFKLYVIKQNPQDPFSYRTFHVVICVYTSWRLNYVFFQCTIVFRDLCVIGLGLDAFMHALHMIGY